MTGWSTDLGCMKHERAILMHDRAVLMHDFIAFKSLR